MYKTTEETIEKMSDRINESVFCYYVKLVLDNGKRGILRISPAANGDLFFPTKDTTLLKQYSTLVRAERRIESLIKTYDFDSHGHFEIKGICNNDVDDHGHVIIGRVYGTDKIMKTYTI